jgi:hypothetical protein
MLLEDCKIVRVSNAVAAGATDSNGAAVDMSGYEGVLFLVAFGAIVSGAATSVKAQQGAASDGSDGADLEGTSVTVADTDDNKIVALDIYRPRSANGKYVRPVVKRATQNATIDSITAILYNGRIKPQALDTTLVALSKSVGSPALGTA